MTNNFFKNDYTAVLGSESEPGPDHGQSNYDEFCKELVLAAANIYCALLASKGEFPNPSNELKAYRESMETGEY